MDVPITSFFPYKADSESTASRKRKVEQEPGVPSKNPKKGKPITKRKAQVENSTKETSFATTVSSGKCSNTHASGSYVNSEHSANTPISKSQKRRRVTSSLQTPPTTIERSSRWRGVGTRAVPSTLQSPASSSCSEPCLSLTPPTDVDRTPRQSANSNRFFPTPSSSTPDTRNTSHDLEFLDSAQRTSYIPSSQSQDGAKNYDSLTALSGPSTSRQDRNPLLSRHTIPSNTNPQSSRTPPRPDRTQTTPFPSAEDYGQTISSSQSQLIDPLDKSPRKERFATNATNIDSNVSISFDSIPSSQTQEIELKSPKKIPSRDCHQLDILSSSISEHRMPNRTPSDELFSVSIQKNVLSGIFAKEESSNLQVDTVATRDEGSFTDSETESEGDDISFEVAASTFPQSSSSISKYISSQRSQSLDDIEGSLPRPLKDFQDMFGSMEGSYPPDFPMSLRL
ncbi:hypothetical protein BDN70DRAFT_925969 [Pholiota conissans]|uniref:Uncharacterized protein n=1 Tax=Pholiota conissans TaxID=109636 RepID=A0A9P5YNH3_9AGAR|nr:hypothetical protein BDN70DRAFT_925969 [Pholiota conissans]